MLDNLQLQKVGDRGKLALFWRQRFIEMCANIHLNMSKNDMFETSVIFVD